MNTVIEYHEDGTVTLRSGLYALVVQDVDDDGARIDIIAPDVTASIRLTGEQLDALAAAVA